MRNAPGWGIDPVPDRLRVFSFFDSLLLWGNLSVSLLVIVAGALLVPALSLPSALLAIVVGAIAGNVLLGLAALIGADGRVPGMVLLRAPLGRRGSYLPTALNVTQNLGWSVFELIVIATAAAALSKRLFGFEDKWLWAIVFGGGASLALGLLGPIGFVRRYLRKFATYALIVSIVYLSWWVLADAKLHEYWHAPGHGGFPAFGQGVDLMIGSIVSWTPLAADYTRFSRTRRSAGIAAGLGYFIPTLWVFALGALLVLSRNLRDVQTIPTAVAAGGALAIVALLAITLDETEKAFADIYSTAVSVQNLLPGISQRLLITVISAIATVGAIVLNLSSYQDFLFLLGSSFVPLFGVLLADWLAAGAHYSAEAIFSAPAHRPRGLVAWLGGFCLYQWLSPVGPSWWTSLVARAHPASVTFTASLPSFSASFTIMGLATLAARKRARRSAAAADPKRGGVEVEEAG